MMPRPWCSGATSTTGTQPRPAAPPAGWAAEWRVQAAGVRARAAALRARGGLVWYRRRHSCAGCPPTTHIRRSPATPAAIACLLPTCRTWRRAATCGSTVAPRAAAPPTASTGSAGSSTPLSWSPRRRAAAAPRVGKRARCQPRAVRAGAAAGSSWAACWLAAPGLRCAHAAPMLPTLIPRRPPARLPAHPWGLPPPLLGSGWVSGALYSEAERDAAVARAAERAAAQARYLEGLRANESLPVGGLG